MPKYKVLQSKIDENILKRNIELPIQFLIAKISNFTDFIKKKVNSQDEKIQGLENRIKVLETLLAKKILDD